MRHRYFPIAALSLSTLLILLSSTFVHASQPGKLQRVKAAVLSNFPPQYSLSDNGKPQGFAIDVIEEVARLGRFEIEYIILDNWPAMFETVKSGRADLIPNQGITEKRRQWFSFSIPVETFPVSIFVRKNQLGISDIDSLFGRRTAAVKLNVGETILAKQKKVVVQKYDHAEEALFALLSGNVDAFVFPEPVLWKLARQAGLDDRVKVVGKPLVEIKRAISVSKDNQVLLEKVNRVLRKLLSSKKYQEIYTKWYGHPVPFWSVMKVLLTMTVLLFVTALVMFFWRYRSVVKLNLDLRGNIIKREAAEEELRQAHDQMEARVIKRTTQLSEANSALENEVIQRRELQKKQEKTIAELEKALSEVKQLSGLLPICANCKKIRDDTGYWHQVEAYIHQHSDAEFSHGLCPDCVQELYPDLVQDCGSRISSE